MYSLNHQTSVSVKSKKQPSVGGGKKKTNKWVNKIKPKKKKSIKKYVISSIVAMAVASAIAMQKKKSTSKHFNPMNSLNVLTPNSNTVAQKNILSGPRETEALNRISNYGIFKSKINKTNPHISENIFYLQYLDAFLEYPYFLPCGKINKNDFVVMHKKNFKPIYKDPPKIIDAKKYTIEGENDFETANLDKGSKVKYCLNKTTYTYKVNEIKGDVFRLNLEMKQGAI